ncbi:MAG: hypothetical protein CK426_08775 [Legionella sp.]|nr:MAG: hypothetical protein CK423_07220 [Legionella sp.]PJD97155.1 MAG: hypothetical protein CK426_08775 [Legionella sp.]
MASVLEFFQLKSRSNNTSIAPLGIHNHLNTQQQKSTDYFKIKDSSLLKEDLLVNIIDAFALDNDNHTSFITACVKLFSEKELALKSLDQKIISSLIVGMVGSSLSFIPFVSYFGALGWGSTVYFLAQRNTAVAEYEESLKLLVATCNWSLGQTAEENTQKLTQAKVIRDMMTCLYPVLTEKQVRDLIDDKIENEFIAELQAHDKQSFQQAGLNSLFASKSENENLLRSKRSAEFNRCIYGYNKGKPMDYLDAFLSIFPDLYQATLDGFQKLQHWYTNNQNATPGNAA